MTEFSPEQVREILIHRIKRDYGTQAAFAEARGVSPTLINLFVRGTRPVSGRVMRFLGLEQIIRYRRKH